MRTNDANKLAIRPTIANIILDTTTSEEEQFLHLTLRPILKLQHDLIIAFFDQYVTANKLSFNALNSTDKKNIINLRFKQDHRMKLELRGIIVGQFTTSEFDKYKSMTTEINRRIYSLIQQRLISNV